MRLSLVWAPTAVAMSCAVVLAGCTHYATRESVATPSASPTGLCASARETEGPAPFLAITGNGGYETQPLKRFWVYWPGMKRPVNFVSRDSRVAFRSRTAMNPLGYAAEFEARGLGSTRIEANEGEGGVSFPVKVQC